MNKYLVEINGKGYDLKDFNDSIVLPEIINSLKIDFNSGETGVNILSILVLLQVLLSKIKNKSEYTILLENALSSMIIIKKLELEAGLGDDVY